MLGRAKPWLTEISREKARVVKARGGMRIVGFGSKYEWVGDIDMDIELGD